MPPLISAERHRRACGIPGRGWHRRSCSRRDPGGEVARDQLGGAPGLRWTGWAVGDADGPRAW